MQLLKEKIKLRLEPDDEEKEAVGVLVAVTSCADGTSMNRGMFELGNVVIREHTNSGKLCLPNWYEAGKPHNRKRSKTEM